MIYSSLGENILNFKDFEFLIYQTVHLVNRRPVAFKYALRFCSGEEMPTPITPELICHGYELLSVNVIPELQPYPEWIYPNPTTIIKSNPLKLNKVRHQLII